MSLCWEISLVRNLGHIKMFLYIKFIGKEICIVKTGLVYRSMFCHRIESSVQRESVDNENNNYQIEVQHL